MKIAVLTLTRDRLSYTRACFRRLDQQTAQFDHYVLDQGSTDGTVAWLHKYAPAYVSFQPTNIGISRGLNHLLDALDMEYDVVVKIDNDCELTRKDTLQKVCEAVVSNHGWLLSPRIEGLRNPVTIERERWFGETKIGETGMLGGIFLAAPGFLYDRYRHDEDNPVWGMDDVKLCQYARSIGFATGYLLDHVANHYATTDGQHATFPGYFDRRVLEGGPA